MAKPHELLLSYQILGTGSDSGVTHLGTILDGIAFTLEAIQIKTGSA